MYGIVRLVQLIELFLGLEIKLISRVIQLIPS